MERGLLPPRPRGVGGALLGFFRERTRCPLRKRKKWPPSTTSCENARVASASRDTWRAGAITAGVAVPLAFPRDSTQLSVDFSLTSA